MSWVMLISVPPLYHIPIQTVDVCIWLYTVSMLGSVECVRAVGSICFTSLFEDYALEVSLLRLR